MKKLIAVAVLAAFSSLPYAAEKDITTDVVVVGQGAAGTAAAFAAAEQGAKVIGLEKKGMVGGTGNFSEGIFAAMPVWFVPSSINLPIQSNGCRNTELSSKN